MYVDKTHRDVILDSQLIAVDSMDLVVPMMVSETTSSTSSRGRRPKADVILYRIVIEVDGTERETHTLSGKPGKTGHKELTNKQ